MIADETPPENVIENKITNKNNDVDNLIVHDGGGDVRSSAISVDEKLIDDKCLVRDEKDCDVNNKNEISAENSITAVDNNRSASGDDNKPVEQLTESADIKQVIAGGDNDQKKELTNDKEKINEHLMNDNKEADGNKVADANKETEKGVALENDDLKSRDLPETETLNEPANGKHVTDIDKDEKKIKNDDNIKIDDGEVKKADEEETKNLTEENKKTTQPDESVIKDETPSYDAGESNLNAESEKIPSENNENTGDDLKAPAVNDDEKISDDKCSSKENDDKNATMADERTVACVDVDEVEHEIEEVELDQVIIQDDDDEEEIIEDDDELEDDDDDEAEGRNGEKNVDLDEDRRNPQYIPKTGMFYEHDDRVLIDDQTENDGDDDEEDEQKMKKKEEKMKNDNKDDDTRKVDETKISIDKKKTPHSDASVKKNKKLWSDDGKWGHDLFNENEQKPKSKDELICTYGYDIRNEDNAPKARRRRRYGRGPNKYTRNWQDETAYGKAKPTGEKSPRTKQDDNVREDIDRKQRTQPPQQQQQRSFRDEKPQPHFDEKQSRDNRDRYRKPTRDDQQQQQPQQQQNFNAQTRTRQVNQQMDNDRTFQKDEFPELPGSSSGNSGVRVKEIENDRRTTNNNNNNNNVWQLREKSSEKYFTDEHKTEPMKIIESIEGKRSTDQGYAKASSPGANNASANKVEMVRTQTFENSRYYNRKSMNNSGPSNNLSNNSNNNHSNNSGGGNNGSDDNSYSKNRQSRSKYENNPNGVGRPIRKTTHLQSNSKEDSIEKRNVRNTRTKEADVHSSPQQHHHHHQQHDYDEHNRSGNCTQQSYLPHQYQYSGEKTSSRAETDAGQSKTKRYSSIRQQQQQRSINENISGAVPQMQSGQGVNLPPNNQHNPAAFFEAASQAANNFYSPPDTHQNRSFAYVPQSTPDSQNNSNVSHQSRYLPQMPTRYLTQAVAAPVSDTHYLPQAVAAPTTAPQAAQHPQVIAASPASFLSTFAPPGYPQFPPPPPPSAAAAAVAAAAAAATTQFHTMTVAPPPPNQLQELYRGGATYYDTTSQLGPRQLPQRRPKNVIPIVAPPTGELQMYDRDNETEINYM